MPKYRLKESFNNETLDLNDLRSKYQSMMNLISTTNRSFATNTDRDNSDLDELMNNVDKLKDIASKDLTKIKMTKKALKLKFSQGIAYDSYLSSKIQKHVLGTKISVFAIKDPEPNAFTLPFSDGVTTIEGHEFEAIIKIMENANKISYTLQDNTITFSGCNNIYVFYQTGLLNCNLTEDEVVAILLHEVGHHTANTMVKISHCYNILSGILLFLLRLCRYIAFFGFRVLPSGFIHIIFTLSCIRLLCALLNISFPSSLLDRPQEYQADYIAGKLGYAKHLMTALDKMETYGNNVFNTKYNRSGFFMRLIMMISRLSLMIQFKLNITSHPTLDQRKDALRDKGFVVEGYMFSNDASGFIIAITNKLVQLVCAI